jgi:hypothetical protein
MSMGLINAADNFTAQWGYYRTLTIITPADITDSITNFPLLVRLNGKIADGGTENDSLVFANALPKGQDIRFSDTTLANHLSYQIEQWDPVNLKAAIWVKIPTMGIGGTIITLRMFYGNATAGDSSTAFNNDSNTAVFSAKNGFLANWHLKDTSDATGSYPLGGTTMPAVSDSGMIGLCQLFDGSSQYFDVPNSENGTLNFSPTSTFTISAWVKPQGDMPGSSKLYNYIVSKGNPVQYCLELDKATYEFDNGNYVTTGNVSIDGLWKYVVAIYNAGGTANVYLNGTTSGNSKVLPGTASGAGNFIMGRKSDGTGRMWNGYLDEISVANVVRSLSWVSLCYQTQVQTASVVTIGVPVVQTAGIINHKSNYTPTLSHNGVLEMYLPNGARVMSIGYDASTTKAQALGTASKSLSKGYYTYRFRTINGKTEQTGKLVK